MGGRAEPWRAASAGNGIVVVRSEEQLNELTAELDSSREQIAQLEHEVDDRMAEYQLLQDEKQNLMDAIEKLELAQSTGEHQQQALQHVLGDRDDRIEQLLGELESSRSEHERTQQVVAEQNAAQEQCRRSWLL